MSTIRQIILPNGKTLQYQLERRARKTLGLKVNHEGLTVHAPKILRIQQIEAVLQKKSRWILQKIQKQTDQRVPPIEWKHQEPMLFLGEDISFNIKSSLRNQQPKLVGNQLELALSDQSQAMVQRKVIHWLQKEALVDFQKRIAFFAKQLGVHTPPLRLSNAKTRWGSCNSRGEIRLSWRLIQAPPVMINYVVCHELSHLKEMNHSSRFYAVLASLMPEHRRAEKALDIFSPQLHRL